MRYRMKIPAKGYGAIYADPPWRLNMGSGKRKLVYDTMTTEEIISVGDHLNAPFVLKPNSHLWLWTTNPHLPEAFTVMQAWGFDYKTMLTWDKGRIGLGWWLRSQTEHVLLGTRHTTGSKRKCPTYRVQPGATSTLLRAPWRGHSVKPTEVYNIIEKLSPSPYLELFAGQGAERAGWDTLSSDLPAHNGPYGDGYTPDRQCKGCPHGYHPTEACGEEMSRGGYCPCSYEINEGAGNEILEYVGERELWPIKNTK